MPRIPTNNCCSFLGCRDVKVINSGYCELHGGKRSENHYKNLRLYKSTAWKKARIAQLSKEPLCAACLLDNKVTQAQHIDHVIPHRRDNTKFNLNLLQSLCASHHTQKTQLESQGIYRYYSKTGIVDYTDTDYNEIVSKL